MQLLTRLKREDRITGYPVDLRSRKPKPKHEEVTREIIDSAHREIPVSADGLVVSSKLAEILGARLGDLVRVEVLEDGVVREPRAVLEEFGTRIPDDMKIRVHDSTADMRYLVLPMRPAGTEGMSEEALAEWEEIPVRNLLLRESVGLVAVVLYLGVLPMVMAMTIFRKFFMRMGFLRYMVFANLVLFMACLPIKMVLRWSLNLKYIVAIPEWFFNI